MTRNEAFWGAMTRARHAIVSNAKAVRKRSAFFILRRRVFLFSSARRRRTTIIYGGGMTLLELGRIAAKYETEMAHAMLFAVAVAKCYGGGKWIKDIA